MTIPLFFLVLVTTTASAQQADTTGQEPVQLESQPQLEARPPAMNTPAVREPAPVVPRVPRMSRPIELPRPPETPPKQAQENAEKEDYDLLKKLFLTASGEFNPLFGRGQGLAFEAGASPMLGYKLTRYLALGPGLGYTYLKQGREWGHAYGPKAFVQALIREQYLLHVENEWFQGVLNLRPPGSNPFRVKGDWVSSTTFGFGYRRMFSEHVGLDGYSLWTIRSTDERNIDDISSPRFRLSVIFHLK
jgi:hypothetical protein